MLGSGCIACGGPIASGEFCPQCGVRQPRVASVDPLVGRVVADRYDVTELLREGGMSRVYHAVQRSLERPVALKIVEPSKLPGVFTEEVVTRFMREARTASQLNHPNVVSIFDFGRTTLDGDVILFLAMELLTGPSLGQVVAKREPLSLERIAEVLRYALAALGEAHQSGITHRDVKPDNIVFDRDRLKVIDFGIARVEAARRLTDAGRVMGTPHYLAPEQVEGATGPSVDLYAIGVILFELLTGRVPFDDPSAVEIVRLHTSAPRPDPRLFAQREIPPALAEVCMRAMAIDPAARYADAESLAQAIASATSETWTAAHSSIFPSAPTSRRDAPTEAPPPAPPKPAPSQPLVSEGPALIGRDGHVAWVRAQLAEPAGLAAIVLWGGAGMGKTRILAELAALAREDGAEVVEIAAAPSPRSQVGWSFARALLAALGGDDAIAPADSREGRGEVVRALREAASAAVRRARGALVVATMDDVDGADGVSRAVVDEVVAGAPIPGFVVVMTRASAPPSLPGVRDMPLTGLSRADARRLVSRASNAPAVAPADARSSDRLVEPLYLEQFLRWRAENRKTKRDVPATLAALVDDRVQALAPPERRALQAVAVVGGGDVDEIASLLERYDEVPAALASLAESGFLRRDGDAFTLAYPIIGHVALRDAPAGAIEQIHARAADALERDTSALELRAWHAIRGRADFEAFALVEESARVRAARGDEAGAIAMLSDGYAASRTSMSRLDERAASAAWIVFGRKLADALFRTGQLVEARGVLSELFASVGPRDAARAPIVEALARIAEHGGRDDEAARWRAKIRESTPMPARTGAGAEPATAARRARARKDGAPPSSRGASKARKR